jgi:hypothetical protein
MQFNEAKKLMFISLAMMEMTLTLAHLYRRYDVCLVDPEEDMELTQQFGLLPGKLRFKQMFDLNSM